eukprot:TRINITY_DN1071_c0_g2_i8.p2 TRINITY_DN1071_c0_g2~~TRINITY_DN1071_c0_g2_i8.p2  ORF type:complete len:157 (+),score=29.51 TRINITY_DN1071_c0_g2_i8:61-471(+)
MCDVSDASLAEAYRQVMCADDTNWCLFGYSDAAQKVVTLVGKGNGGIEELKSHLAEDKCNYGYCKFVTGDDETKRQKFVFFSWVGEKVSPLKRAKISVHKAEIKTIIKNFTVELHATTLEDLEEAKLVALIQKANY